MLLRQRKKGISRAPAEPHFAVRLGGTALLLLSLGFSGGCRAQQPWPLWEAYTARFVDNQGRVIDHTAGDRTTSEGQAYAMFFALVDNDRDRFNKLLGWTEANLAEGDLTAHLPAWDWGRTDSGAWKTRDSNSASDADVWMAYTLLEAGRLWHDPRYTGIGRSMAERIAREEIVLVPGIGTTLAPGPHGFHPHDDSYVLNPSYLPLPILTYLAQQMPLGPWSSVVASLPALLDQSSPGGFAMDWVETSPEGVHAVAAPHDAVAAATPEQHAAGSYDAIRVYLWLGLADPHTPGASRLLHSTHGMAELLRNTTSGPPLAVSSSGTVMDPSAPVGFAAAVIPYLARLNLPAEQKRESARLQAARNPATGLYGTPGNYYDQNLALFSTGWSDQRFTFDDGGKLHLKWK